MLSRLYCIFSSVTKSNITFFRCCFARGGGRKFYLHGGGAELIKCIDPNEGEALKRGSTFKPGGLAPLPPPPPVPPNMFALFMMKCPFASFVAPPLLATFRRPRAQRRVFCSARNSPKNELQPRFLFELALFHFELALPIFEPALQK